MKILYSFIVTGKGVCAQSTLNSEKQKYNSIIIGTVSSVGMLLTFLFIAGFVFWRLDKQEVEGKLPTVPLVQLRLNTLF